MSTALELYKIVIGYKRLYLRNTFENYRYFHFYLGLFSAKLNVKCLRLPTYLKKNATDVSDLKDIRSCCTDFEPQNDLTVKSDNEVWTVQL